MLRKIKNIFSNVEWQWSLYDRSVIAIGAIASFGLPAWAVSVMGYFSEFHPLSWIVAGLGGLLGVSLIGLFRALTKRWRITAQFDEARLKSSGPVNPMKKSFEAERIVLADFILPSSPIIAGKTFVNCEIIGPCNLYLRAANQVKNPQNEKIDGVVLDPHVLIMNAFQIDNCTFVDCRFVGVTFIFSLVGLDSFRTAPWMNWLTQVPPPIQPALIPDNSHEEEPSHANEEELEASPKGQD